MSGHNSTGATDKVAIFDTTLRDGEQSPGFSMNIQEKLQVAKQMERLKVDIIEAGFPVASEGDFEAVRLIARTIKDCTVAALARAEEKDIDRAWEAIREAREPRIHTFISTSDFHLKYQLRLSQKEVLKKAVEAVKRAKSYTSNVEFSTMDATRTGRDYLCQVVEAAIDAGATTINIPDTVGYAIPHEFGELIQHLRKNVPNIDKAVLSVHCHNDLGLAVANSLAAVLNGARQVECAVNGIGERAGNASLEELVMSIRTRKDFFHLTTRVVTEHIYAASRLISQITGIMVQPNKAIVGKNAFSHESGIHQDGLLKEKITYEIMTPESIGIPQSTLVLGKHSGRHAFRDRLQGLGFELTDEEVNSVFKRFKDLADKKKEVFDEDLIAIISDETLRVPETYRLINLNAMSGTFATPTATVELEVSGERIKQAGFGDGPVDAAFRTIAKMIGTKSKLLKFSVNAITGGTDAQGEVTVRLEENDVIVTGQGAHTDIIVASAKAYINALNRLAYLSTSKPKRSSKAAKSC